MSPTAPRLRILSVGGNAVSAFLSWRLQATNACDVTLVWKSGFDSVSQYGISFRSTSFGNERFKPRHVVRTPEEASNNKEGAFDYVLLCVKALPDVYDLAAVIESVVTPQHTCILVNTTHTLGVESHLEQRFPTNVVLSLVSVAEIAQLGASEFEHKGSTEIWVGPANKNASIPTSIQQDMAEALAMTLSTGQVECKVANNIRQQQYERMIGPIAFHPASVIFETASHSALVEKVGVRQLVNEIFDEIIQIAHAQDCKFPEDFKSTVMEEMLKPTETNSIMYQDFTARRPMEVETYLGSPIKLALSVGVKVPRIETLYALLHHMNIINQQRPKEDRALLSPTGSTASTVPRMASAPPQRPPMMNGRGRGGRTYSMVGPPPGMRRGPPMNGGPPNGYGRPMTGQGYPNAPRNLGPPGMGAQSSRRGSMEHDLEDFSHLVLYDDIPEAGELRNGNGNGVNGGHIDERERTMLDDRALREREYMLRQREAAIREQELRMRQRGPVGPPPGSRRGPPPSIRNQAFDDDDEDDFVDPAHMASLPMIDPDNFDMMSVTSKRNRKTTAPPASQLRKNPDTMDINVGASRRGPSFGRPTFGRNRSSARIMPESVNGLHDALMDDPMMRYSDNRYGGVDRQQLHSESRSNSLTAAAARLDELTVPNGQNGAYPGPRRVSQSPGNLPFSPHDGRGNARRSPPNGYMGGPVNGRPSPPGGMRHPIPRHPGGQGHSVAPQQVEQHAGVSALRPPKASNNVRSLTGSASASAGSGDSANIDSENSAHSSQSSLGPHAPIGVR